MRVKHDTMGRVARVFVAKQTHDAVVTPLANVAAT